jgi:hypothetical protein
MKTIKKTWDKKVPVALPITADELHNLGIDYTGQDEIRFELPDGKLVDVAVINARVI